MSMNWSPEELETKLAENPELKVIEENPLPKLASLLAKPTKYRSRRTEYNGVKYASKKEAKHAEELNLLVKAGELSFWLRQIPFSLPGGTVYRLDFAEFRQVVNTSLYQIDWVEVKGYKTPVGELKRKQTEALFGIEITVI